METHYPALECNELLSFIQNMKNIFLITQFLLLTLTGWSQSRIGSTLDELKEEFKDPSYRLTQSESDKSNTVQILTKESKVIYFIDKETKICVYSEIN